MTMYKGVHTILNSAIILHIRKKASEWGDPIYATLLNIV